jgi:hypothetical protein
MQIHNAKGAPAWKSTGNPFLDLFANNNLTVESCVSTFSLLVETIVDALGRDTDTFLKLMKYTRNVNHGKGSKLMYYMMVSVLRRHLLPVSCDEYMRALEWSHECNKDILHLGHINYQLCQIEMPEIKLYASHLRALLECILRDVTNWSIDLLYLKYINTGHFSHLSKLIWRAVGKFDMNLYHPVTENGQFIMRLLAQTGGCVTNKAARLIKTRFHQDLHLLDRLFQGFFPDGTPICETTGEEYKLVADLLGKCATKCGMHAIACIEGYTKPAEGFKAVLIKGLKEHQQRIRDNKTKVKVHGVDLSDRCMEFYNGSVEDPLLEAQLTELAATLRTSLASIGGLRKLKKLGQKLNVIIDHSGSMEGKPLNSALYQTLMYWEVFKIKKVYFFSDTVRVVELPEIAGMCAKIKHLYILCQGSTNLQSVFDHLMTETDINTVKMNLVLTDGDCDPDHETSNPFHTALVHFPNHMFCVYNLKQEALAFPYLETDSRVCYISGNNPALIGNVIKCMAIALKNEIQISPTMILQESLSKFDTSTLGIEQIEIKTTETYQDRYASVVRNTPKKKSTDESGSSSSE